MNFLILLLASAPPSLAPRSTVPPTAALFVEGSEGTSPAIAPTLEIQLANALRHAGVEVAAWKSTEPTPDSAAMVKRISEGRQAYDNLDIDTAIDKLTQARTFFLAHPAEAEAGAMGDLLVALGAAYLQNGLTAEANKSFIEALLMNPDLKPSTKLFTPDVQAGFAAARDQLAQRARGKVSIVTEPLGTRVELHGQPLGTTPLPTYELPAGRHLIRLQRTGYERAGVFVEVRADQTAEIKTTLKPIGNYAQASALAAELITGSAFDDNGIPKAAKALGQLTQSRYLVLVKVSPVREGKTSAHTQVWDLANSSRLKNVTFEVEENLKNLPTVAETLRRWMAQSDAIAQAQGGVAGADNRPVYKRWWFWTAVGSAAVIGAVSTVAVIHGKQSRGRADNLILGLP